jgi:hypothetical protein
VQSLQQSAAVQQLLQYLHQLAEQRQQQCGARGLANIMWAFGGLRYSATITLLLPELLLPRKLPQAKPQEVSNSLWAVAKSAVQLSEGDVQQLVQHFVSVLSQATPQAVSNTLWAAATLGVQLSEGDVQQLVQRFVRVLPQAKPQEVSNTLWTVATLAVQLSGDDAQQLMQHFVRVLPQANPQNASNTLWAVATLGVQLTEGDVQQLVQRFVRVLQDAKPPAVSNTLWAVAKLGVQLPEGDTQELMQRFVQVLPQATPQNVSNTLWAVATLGVQLTEGDVQQLVQHFVRVLQDAKPQAVSNTLWAAATLGVQLQQGDVQKLVQRLVQVLPQAKPQEVSNSLWAVATMGRTLPARQLDQLLSHFQAQLPGCKPQEVANTAWACGRMQYAPLQLQWGARLQDRKAGEGCNLQGICSLCWCAAVLDLQQYVPQVLQLAAACSHMWGTAVGEVLCQLYQVHLWLLDSQLPAPGQGLLGVLSQQQLQQCQDSWEQSLAHATTAAKASDLHRSVFAAVTALPAGTWQHTPVLEQRTADGALSIDIAATTVSGVRLAIEVDRPSHFVQPKGSYDGSTLFRNRALATRGYVVVSIQYWEWVKLRDGAQKQQYLLGKLWQQQ